MESALAAPYTEIIFRAGVNSVYMLKICFLLFAYLPRKIVHK